MAIDSKPARFNLIGEFFRPEQCLAIFIISLLVLARYWSDIFLNELRGEDGTDLLVSALWGSPDVFKPVASSMMVVQRSVAALSAAASFEKAPMIMSILSAGLFIYTAAYFSRSTFSWLIRSYRARLIICALTALGPGSSEIVSNLACTQYTFAWLLGLTLLEEPFLRLTSFSCVWVMFSLSSHISAIFWPLAVFRDGLRSPQTRVATFCCGGNLIFHFILGRWSPYKVAAITVRPLTELIPIWVDNFSAFFFFVPLIDHDLFVAAAYYCPWFVRTVGIACGCTFIALLYFHFRRQDFFLRTMSGVILSIMFLVVAHSLARSEYSHSTMIYMQHYDARYVWIPCMTGSLFICCLMLKYVSAKRSYLYLSALLFFKVIDFGIHLDQRPRFPPTNTWKEFVAALKTDQDHFSIDVAPATRDGKPWARINLRRQPSGLVLEEVLGGNK